MSLTYERPSAGSLNGRSPDRLTSGFDGVPRPWREGAKGVNNAVSIPVPTSPVRYSRDELVLRTGVARAATLVRAAQSLAIAGI